MQAMTKQRHMDMLNGPLWNKLPRYALPVAATGILGQLFNAADIAVVGNFTGDAHGRRGRCRRQQPRSSA